MLYFRSFGPRLGTAPSSARKKSPRRRRSDASSEGGEADEEELGSEVEQKGKLVFPPSRPRNSFYTQDIRGCMAIPATTECDIGPGHYDVPDPETLARIHKHGWSFGKADRFSKPGKQCVRFASVRTERA